ncbi:hypothetical protein BD626DRAFT_83726 [Schizophyllum amplum]|uniref:Uncharacterized protein n=1 Tax=Schizophyllum amplum TaxID=97359 RepID=A0A550C8T4_9AGAR|nr:hypothetical protein BD626DRAFT_83726 [Auriculariopsis ampla]
MTSVASTSASGGAWDDEAAFDKFATLFSPPTPRASPTSEAKNAKDARATAPPHRPPIAVSDSDFGSFVSVSANEDPLSFMSSSANVLPPPMQPSFAPLTPQPTRTPTMPASSKPNHTRANPSLDFFDAFGREAKEASERNKRQVLDELLLHEEDPLYFASASTSNGSAPWQSSTSGQPFTDAPSTMSPGVEVDEEFGELQSSASASASAPSFDASLIDFDPVATPQKPPSLADLSESTIGDPHHQPHHHSHHHIGSPTRQSTLTPSTLAPPLTSSNSASSIPITPVNELPSEYPFPISSSPRDPSPIKPFPASLPPGSLPSVIEDSPPYYRLRTPARLPIRVALPLMMPRTRRRTQTRNP